ncbi:hypothetical protein M378DRAFT_91759 [Amanita muscaria Koide BX008]|uniref:Gag-like protein n=1 Tax=Amanita muscaria (strain Koide BX008) TaxID=946122 RepID=A0A0C2W185_AMAMK|nr:hypothetical protein M378DRAFT_91759 [Amanita muscaria Koide BX008]
MIVKTELQRHPTWREVELHEDPIILPHKTNKTICTILLKVRDDRKGSQLRYLTKTSIPILGEIRRVREWLNSPTTRQCSQCQRWGHTVHTCRSRSPFCAICGEAHPSSSHDSECKNCIGAGLSNCSCHREHCINCGDSHSATSKNCEWFKARNSQTTMKTLLDKKRDNNAAIRQARNAAKRPTFGTARKDQAQMPTTGLPTNHNA